MKSILVDEQHAAEESPVFKTTHSTHTGVTDMRYRLTGVTALVSRQLPGDASRALLSPAHCSWNHRIRVIGQLYLPSLPPIPQNHNYHQKNDQNRAVCDVNLLKNAWGGGMRCQPCTSCQSRDGGGGLLSSAFAAESRPESPLGEVLDCCLRVRSAATPVPPPF
jgi:hypothetical protein